MQVSPSIRTHHRIVCRVVALVLAAIICGTATELVSAEESESNHPELKLSLREAIQAAIDNNVNVRLLKERIAAAQSQANTSLGTLLPNVSGFVNGRNQTVNLAAFGLPSDRLAGLGLTRSVTDPFEVYDARATLVQNIFSLSLIQRWRAARTGVDVATLEAEVTKRDVMAMVGLLYIEALRADEAVKARQADIDLSQQLLKLARDRRAAGIATGLDVTREEVQLENNKQRLLVSQNEQESARLNLIRALGIAFDVRLTLTDELKFIPPEPLRAEEALTVAREQRVELRAQETRQRLAALSLSSATGEHIPSLSLTGDYGWIGLKPEDALATRSIGLTFSIPIFDGGQREGRISETCSRVRRESIRMKDVSWFMSISEVLTITTIFSVLMTLVILAGTAVSLFGILHGVFDVPMKGSLLLYFAMTTLYVFTTAGLGLVAATIATNQAQVSLMTILVVAPMINLSGTWTPPEAMPVLLRDLMQLSPLYHFVTISYGIQLRGVGLDILWPSIISMLGLGGSLFGFGMWRFRRQFQ